MFIKALNTRHCNSRAANLMHLFCVILVLLPESLHPPVAFNFLPVISSRNVVTVSYLGSCM